MVLWFESASGFRLMFVDTPTKFKIAPSYLDLL